MKIKSITLNHYKKFQQSKTWSFEDSDGDINDKTLIVGNNGSGKTSILQAIVILLASAIRDKNKFNARELDWSGFEYRHLQTGRLPLLIEAEIVFDKTEIEATKKHFDELKTLGVKLLSKPAANTNVTIFFDYENCKTRVKKGGASTYNQFSGYQYAKRLTSFTSNKKTLFENVGNIYWYTEQRNSFNTTNLEDEEVSQLDDIRTFLASAYNFHIALQNGKRVLQEGEFDFYEDLEKLYRLVFPNRSFEGAAPRFDIYEKAKTPDFFLYDGNNQYEISGMSAGERAIFPILMDFVRWNINNSIIIIDELELHLHPPLQQAFIRALLKMGNNNQFIFTSHSNIVASMFDEDENQIIRLS